jgi:uncharacterized protein YqjF (DUF2071 family)
MMNREAKMKVITRIKSPNLLKIIKNQVDRVNAGQNVEMDYSELRRLQKHLADDLVVSANGAAIRVTPKTLKLLNKFDFHHGETIRVSKYAVECNYFKTVAWNVNTFQDVTIKDMPQYLRGFINV